MSTINSPLATGNAGIPLVRSDQLGQLAGSHIHFPDFTTFTTAIANERANIIAGSPLWADGQPMTIATETTANVVRKWNAANAHARTVVVNGMKSVTLQTDSNVVYTTSGTPPNTYGVTGDLAVDPGNAYYTSVGTNSWGLPTSLQTSTSRILSGTVTSTAPVVISTTTAGISGPFYLNIQPDVGCTIQVESSVNGGVNWSTYGSLTSAQTIIFDKAPVDLVFVNTIRLTLTIGSSVRSRYSLGETVSAQTSSIGSLVLWTGGSGGNASVGNVLTASLQPNLYGTFQIQRNGVNISGATSSAGVNSYSYTVVSADNGATLTPIVTNVFMTAPALTVGVDVVPPQLYSVSIQLAAQNTIQITFDENLNTTAPPASAFTISGSIATLKTISSVNVSANIVNLVCSSNFGANDIPILTYTVPGTNPIRDLAGNATAAFSNYYVANNLTLPAQPASALGSSYITNSTTGVITNPGQGGDFTYAANLIVTGSGWYRAVFNDNGWIEMQCTDTASNIRAICFQQGGGFSNMNWAAVLSNGKIQPYDQGAYLGTPYTLPTTGTNVKVRIRRIMSSGLVTMDTTTDSVNWTTLYSFARTNSTTSNPPTVYVDNATIGAAGVALQGAQLG